MSPRYFSHVLIVVMAATIATASGIATAGVARGSSKRPWQFEPFAIRSFSQAPDYLSKPALPFTTVRKQEPERAATIGLQQEPQGPTTYEVRSGDSVTSIAQRFGITPETIVSANALDDADSLAVGDKLTILPVSGVLHVVRAGDTVESIARQYQVDADIIIESEYNNLSEPYILSVDQKIVVPGGKMPEVQRPRPTARGERPAETQPSPPPQNSQPASASPEPVRGGGRFVWPTTGLITQGFSGYHPGIDIAPPYGSPIYASDAGVVISVEYLSYGYGWNLVIDHGDGYTSRYSHVSKFLVGQGQKVSRGQLVALTGNTGLSTGPHLDFRLYQNGVAENPLKYLP
ncbi:MAG: M23 family metallopeptidase [Chloroflexi bacterium]|nr:M23 family metallopeptidase [Chloroflexota bacterium]